MALSKIRASLFARCFLVFVLFQQQVSAALTTTQIQTLPFSFGPTTITNGASDVRQYTLQFKPFTAPKYVGTLDSLSIQTTYNVALTFQALQPSNFGDSWPIVYRFSYSPNVAYAAGALGSPVDIPVTYRCLGPAGCTTGGAPFPDARVVSSINLAKDQLGLRALVGNVGGPLELNQLTVMGGSVPAILTSTLTGTVTATANYTAQFPPAIKQQAALLGASLDGISAALTGLGVIIDPGRTLSQASIYFIGLAIGRVIDKIDASIGDASASGGAAYKAFQTIMSGIENIAKVLVSTGVPTNPGGLLLGAMSVALDGFSYIAGKIAADPPDANYKEIAAIQPIDIGFLQSSLPDLPVFATGKAVLADILSATQALISILISMERVDGAKAAGDQFWVLEQSQQLSDALVAYNDITARLQTNWNAFMEALANDGALEQNRDTVVDGDDLAQALSEDAFSSVSDFIDENDLTESVIADIMAEIGSKQFVFPTESDYLSIAAVGDKIYETGDLTLQIRATQAVPEPGFTSLFALGLLMLVAVRRRKNPLSARAALQRPGSEFRMRSA